MQFKIHLLPSSINKQIFGHFNLIINGKMDSICWFMLAVASSFLIFTEKCIFENSPGKHRIYISLWKRCHGTRLLCCHGAFSSTTRALIDFFSLSSKLSVTQEALLTYQRRTPPSRQIHLKKWTLHVVLADKCECQGIESVSFRNVAEILFNIGSLWVKWKSND